YSTWAAFQGNHYWVPGTNYLSPFYSPELFGDSPHSWFGPKPDWIPSWAPWSPAFLILWAPGGFRFTCYYYRGAYYKAFWGDPMNCSVGEPGFRKENYRGEQKFPLILQNVHRYFVYLAILFLFLLAYDAVMSYVFTNPETNRNGFGIGVGSLVLTINPILLGGYTLGCHSVRHLIGGRKNELGSGATKKAYDCVSCLNRGHMRFAWVSLFWVGFTDFYVRMCASGYWSDFRIL
ncbi:MAG: succinate dehydrogenase, partial [Phycisphaerales bacterium]